MSSPRELVTKEIIAFQNAFVPGTGNAEIYETYLNNMSDKAFSDFIERLRNKTEKISVFLPINSKFKLRFSHIEKIARKLNYSFWHRLRLTDSETGQIALTQSTHMVIDLILRRQVQMLWKKMSVAEDSKHIDVLTGQPTNESKGSSTSFPENNAMIARGMVDAPTELIKMRGGDTDAYNLARRLIQRNGVVSLKDIEHLPTRAKVVDTTSAYLKAMHLRNNL